MSWLSDIKLLLGDREVRKDLGDSTSAFNITDEGSNVARYTYDSGTKPDFSQLMIGSTLCINGENFNVSNNFERILVTGYTLEYFEITNIAIVAEGPVTIGTGYLQLLTQLVSDEQYLAWANQAIANVNRIAGTSYPPITSIDDITDDLLKQVVDEYVQCKWGQKMATDSATGFKYNDGINMVDKTKTADNYKNVAEIHCAAYDEALAVFVQEQGTSSTFSTGSFIIS